MVYKVAATEFLPLRERPLKDADEDTYISYVKKLLITGPMYFSYSCDITNTFQRQAQSDLSAPLWHRADDRFYWNRFISSDLIDFRNGGPGNGPRRAHGPQVGVDPYILPVMFGMMSITQTRVKSTSFTFVLMTRRSRFRGGTRYLRRGIDENGNVSNFNETEQVVVLNDAAGSLGGFGAGTSEKAANDGREVQVLSYVQTRGSVPVFWAEVNTLHYTPRLQVKPVQSGLEATKKHFDEQIAIYGDNYLVNLVNQKGREMRVKEAYEEVVRILMSSPSEATQKDEITDEKFHVVEPTKRRQNYDKLHYIYFDFHNETKGLKWHRAKLLLDKMRDGLIAQQYFRAIDMPGDTGKVEIRNQQTSVVRTNCMDCLDRTNVVQSMLGRYALDRMFTELGVLKQGEAASDDAAFENHFRNVWADNADVVSKSYSGTGALKTDFTRTGERTKAGALQDLSNSITRYLKNNFADGPRQDGFDIFLGTHQPDNGTSLVFVDRRPVLLQAMPYLLAGSVFLVFISLFTRRVPDSAVWPIRVFTLFWLAVAAWSFNFIFSHGTLYVSLPGSAIVCSY
jgi:phosphatidylinositol 4-phosphatase